MNYTSIHDYYVEDILEDMYPDFKKVIVNLYDEHNISPRSIMDMVVYLMTKTNNNSDIYHNLIAGINRKYPEFAKMIYKMDREKILIGTINAVIMKIIDTYRDSKANSPTGWRTKNAFVGSIIKAETKKLQEKYGITPDYTGDYPAVYWEEKDAILKNALKEWNSHVEKHHLDNEYKEASTKVRLYLYLEKNNLFKKVATKDSPHIERNIHEVWDDIEPYFYNDTMPTCPEIMKRVVYLLTPIGYPRFMLTMTPYLENKYETHVDIQNALSKIWMNACKNKDITSTLQDMFSSPYLPSPTDILDIMVMIYC